MKCRKKRDMKSPVKSKTKKGTPMWLGSCATCGTKLARLGG